MSAHHFSIFLLIFLHPHGNGIKMEHLGMQLQLR